ncbi:MAG: CDP-2,3-bis-(O-geranylgeranyl)-sn-glycerol synthase [Candidatus Aenigmatarchaeota archaeon]
MIPDIVIIIINAFWFIIPAYAANAFPPLARGRKPLDEGMMFGKSRLLGDGKTLEGTIAALVFGFIFGILQLLAQGMYDVTQIGLFEMTIQLILFIVIGAIAGDLIGSFVKRRIGLKRGAMFIGFDQLGFVIFALIFAAPLLMLRWESIIFLLIVTPVIHWIGNIIGYLGKVKQVPW